jgi:hypothetical protein
MVKNKTFIASSSERANQLGAKMNTETRNELANRMVKELIAVKRSSFDIKIAMEAEALAELIKDKRGIGIKPVRKFLYRLISRAVGKKG